MLCGVVAWPGVGGCRVSHACLCRLHAKSSPPNQREDGVPTSPRRVQVNAAGMQAGSRSVWVCDRCAIGVRSVCDRCAIGVRVMGELVVDAWVSVGSHEAASHMMETSRVEL